MLLAFLGDELRPLSKSVAKKAHSVNERHGAQGKRFRRRIFVLGWVNTYEGFYFQSI